MSHLPFNIKHHIYPILIAIGSSTDNLSVGFTLGLKKNTISSSNSDSNVMSQNTSNANTKTEVGMIHKKHCQIDSFLLTWNQFNLLISTCNALGAWVAGKGGLYAIDQLGIVIDYFFSLNKDDNILYSTDTTTNTSVKKNIPSLLAAIAFSYLAMEEFKCSFSSHLPKKNQKNNSDNDSRKEEDLNPKSSTSNDEDEFSKNDVTAANPFNFKSALKLAIPMTLNNLAGGVASGTVGVSAEYSCIMAFLCSFGMMEFGFRVASRAKLNHAKSSNNYYYNTKEEKNYGIQLDGSMVSGIVFTVLASSQYWDFCSNNKDE